MPSLAHPAPALSLNGRIEHITYHNGGNHFTIARFCTDENRSRITIKGTMPDPKVGQSVEIGGEWETHARYGPQFRFTTFRVRLPATVDGIRSYLASGAIKGVSPKLVDRIMACFAADTLTVLEETPQRLTEVAGIGGKTARRIVDAWRQHHAAGRLVRFLEENGVDTAHTARLLREYGPDAIDLLCNDPYRVAEDIPRVGFAIADAIVRHADTPVDEMDRATACLRHLFEMAVDQGHTFIEQAQLVGLCRQNFELTPDTVGAALEHLVEAGDLVMAADAQRPDSSLVFPAALYRADTTIARRIETMQRIAPATGPPDRGRLTDEVLQKLAIRLSADQERVLMQAIGHKVAVVTGGPGTGKTTLIRAITAAMTWQGRSVLLAAPTGRAARRLAQLTDRPAATLHRMLGYHLADGRFERTEDDPLAADVVIVDEASMVDTLLMADLIRAVPLTSHLILVGDAYQLPSVGPGNVLADLIRSEKIGTFELTEIFRQEEQGPIVINAHRIRNGLPPVITPSDDPESGSDLYFVQQADPQKVVATVVRFCRHEIPRRFHLDPVGDVQVLCPMHRGVVGTLNLNRVLQEALNPAGEPVAALGGRFKVGDKVMHLRNNYRKEVFNGEIGIVARIELENERVEVDFEGRTVAYDLIELDELTLAYAISVHKAQGSEYPAVVIPLLTQHYIMLQRNLLYTALTRGKQVVVIVGTAKALEVAFRNDRPRQRRSLLAQRLNPTVGWQPPDGVQRIDEPDPIR
jgi:exodeoxyribonuclease V alpha subunit